VLLIISEDNIAPCVVIIFQDKERSNEHNYRKARGNR